MLSRRKFIKNSGMAVATASFMPSLGLNFISEDNNSLIYQNFILKGFDDEQEESPSIVCDGNGDMWMFSLRRLSYPDDKEVIAAFRYNGKSWLETDPVTKTPGQYEVPTAVCAAGGQPVVAWTEINSAAWNIKVSRFTGNGFERPYHLPAKTGRSINPVLLAVNKNRNWIAWENFFEGKLRIFISKYDKGNWKEPVVLSKGDNSCFDPAIAEAKNGDLFIAYGLTDGYHQNIEMSVMDGQSLQIKKTVPIAIGGGLKNRVNLNTKPALAFDASDRLWISYENNRNTTRLEDGDNYTGDRCCAILSYKDGKVVEPVKTGKWLFSGKNDHKPTFVKDNNGRLYMATHCGGNFEDNPHWQYRLSWLDPQKGWGEPISILKTAQKGNLIAPAITFDNTNLWLATCYEKHFDYADSKSPAEPSRSRLSRLTVLQLSAPQLSDKYAEMDYKETTVREFLPNEKSVYEVSGHPRIAGEKITVNGNTYALACGNMHEHSNISSCWPAGTDGTLHDDYRFGMFSEGYDFIAITDHGYALNEVFWRNSLRLAEFYNDPPYFVSLPALEWTLTTGKNNEVGSVFAAGHYNIIFASTGEARKFIRNRYETYSVRTPETKNAHLLWQLLHKIRIDCVTIPHHPASRAHPVDWSVHDDSYAPVVEIFQCRGNAEYPGCPRAINVTRHRPRKDPEAFVNYALLEKKYKMAFIASGDHNSMGVGVAALWLKELSRKGILEALRSRRTFATTGDKIVIDFRINETNTDVINPDQAPRLGFKIKGQKELDTVEILRNSEVLKTYKISDNAAVFNGTFIDKEFKTERDVLYYYMRATQKNKEIGWSSPLWIENA